jgi:hypothetical protein
MLPGKISTIILVVLLVNFRQSYRPIFTVSGECLGNPELNAEFEILDDRQAPSLASCCMFDVCGLTCPKAVSQPDKGKNTVLSSFQFV